MLGQRLHNFSIVRLLGEGGMSSVYEAEHPFIRRKVAVKVLRSELSADGTHVQRFFNEARAASAIRHPNIVEVIDVGRFPDGTPYLVMELLEGECLADRLERTGSLEIASAVEIAYQTASALEAAHALEVVHRDLKPDNLFIVPDPRLPGHELVKVLDFGIAKLRGELAAPPFDTLVGAVLGTPPYMSPEQCRGVPEEIDERTDVYALGIILYEMICGRPPFVAAGAGELMVLHMTEAPEPPSQLCPVIPPELERTILCALAKNREDRFASMSDFRATLAEIGSELGVIEAPANGRSRPVTLGGGLRAPAPPAAFESDTTLTAPKIAPRSSAPPRERPVTREQLRRETPLPSSESHVAVATPSERAPVDEERTIELPAQLVTEATPSESDLDITIERSPAGLQPIAAAPDRRRGSVARSFASLSFMLSAAVALVLLESSIHFPIETAYLPARSGRVAPPAEDHATRQAQIPTDAPGSPAPSEVAEEVLQSIATVETAEPAPIADPSPSPATAPQPRAAVSRPSAGRRTRARAVASPAPRGYLSLDSSPWAEVFLGAERLGTTPLNRVPLPAGKHLLRLQNPELGVSTSYSIEIEPGKAISRLVGWGPR